MFAVGRLNSTVALLLSQYVTLPDYAGAILKKKIGKGILFLLALFKKASIARCLLQGQGLNNNSIYEYFVGREKSQKFPARVRISLWHYRSGKVQRACVIQIWCIS